MQAISRRVFLRMSAVTGAATLAAACQLPATQTPAALITQPTTVPQPAPPVAPSKYNEAPMLAALVAKGELPPVDDRLPVNPFVIEGVDGIGNYGGTWRMQKKGEADVTGRTVVVSRGLTDVDQNLTVKTYLAESYENSEDGRTWTFHLRSGVKWSDGAPMTSEDYRFWYEDLTLNREYTTVHPNWIASVVDGVVTPVEFSAPDDYTVSYTFPLPNGLWAWTPWIAQMNTPCAPAHFLKPFHPTYGNKAEIDALVASNPSWDTWTVMLTDKNNPNKTPERPTFEPWVNQAVWSSEVLSLVRNAYFWEVDTAGNQLPYIDYLQYRDFTQTDVAVMRAINGETDCQARHLGYDSYTVFKENEAAGDYTAQLWLRTSVTGIIFNSTTKDPRLAELFTPREFRMAISLGVNRDEMREMLLDGFGTNMQYCPPADSPYYYEKLAKAYIEYDPDRANQMLDDLGYAQRDADGYRVFKDGSGERIRFTSIGTNENMTNFDLMLVDYFKALGMEMNYRGMDRALLQQLCQANEAEVLTKTVGRTLIPIADTVDFVRNHGVEESPIWATYQAWYIDPNDPIAVEPPQDHYCRKLWAANDELWQAVGDEAQKAAWFKIADVWAEELPMPGFYGNLPQPVIVKNGFKGLHESYWEVAPTMYEHIFDNATWFWDQPEKHVVY